MDITDQTRLAKAFVLTLLLPIAAAEANVIAVANGDAAPDLDGQYSSFIAPTINSAGTIVFNARLTNTADGNATDSGIFAYPAVSPDLAVPVIIIPRQLVREGQSVQYDSGGTETSVTIADVYLSRHISANFQFGGAPVTGNFSNVAIELPLASGLANNSAIGYWDGAIEDIRILAREDDEAPDGNGTYDHLTGFRLFGITPTDRVGFHSAFDNTDDGNNDDAALLLSQSQPGGDGVVQMIREGEAGAGNTNLFTSPRLNNAGTIAFLGTPFPNNVVGQSTIFRLFAPGNPTPVISEGDAAPEGNGTIHTLTQLRINNLDEVAFIARLSGTDGIDGSSAADDSAIFAGTPGALVELVREGDLLPDGSGRFGYFYDAFQGSDPQPAFNDRGEVAFRITLRDVPSDENLGIFRADASEILEIARRGDDTGEGTFANFQDPLLNNQGLVAFHADVLVGTESGPEGEASLFADALFVSDGEDLVEVIRSGDTLSHFGSERAVRGLILNNDPTGPVNGLSDYGTLAYLAEFEGGGSAVAHWRPSIGWRRDNGAWDDADNWNLGLDPNITTDVSLGTDSALEIDGPQANTVVNSLVVGAGAGSTTLRLGAGSLGTIEGMEIAASGTLAGTGSVAGLVTVLGQVVTDGTLTFSDSVQSAGLIHIGPSGEVVFDGDYAGSGQFTGPGVAIMNALVSPGNSPGILDVEGNLVFGQDARVLMEIEGDTPGSEHDQVVVGGMLTLGGTLELAFGPGVTPLVGDSWVLFLADVFDGGFTDIIAPGHDALRFDLLFHGGSGILAVQAVPVPGGIVLLLPAVAALALRRRRGKGVRFISCGFK